MESTYVRYMEYIKYLAREKSEIDDVYKKIINGIPEYLKNTAINYKYTLEKDLTFDSTSTLGERLVFTSKDLRINKYLKEEGPFILIVGVT